MGASTPREPEKDLRFDDFVSDALTWTHLLEGDPRFRSVSILGHSEGALIGIVAAERDPKIAALVTLAGAGRDLATILDEQVRKNPANSPNIVAEAEAYDASLRLGNTVTDPDPLLAALYRTSVQPYLISEFAYDPQREIARLHVPVCILQGTTDVQVGVADARALAGADPSAKLVLLDGVNHMFVDAPPDLAANAATYGNAALPIDARVAPAIATFLP
ncbi:MAG: alpha/beta fold hydrolase [Candidatus Eremiobacteraeota bacterium]|nr:alpha/beta fold hydrolase [Candidatus Eremiobacteraeota bacterium]